MSDKKTPSLMSLSKQTTRLDSLSQLKKTTRPSLQSLAALSNKPELSLQNIAKRSTANSLSSLKNTKKSHSLVHLASRPTPVTTPLTMPVTPPPPIPSSLSDVKEDRVMYSHELCAPPSSTALFLFKQCENSHHPVVSHTLEYGDESMKKSSIATFEFNTPSPDDIVFNAQNMKKKKNI